MTKDPVTPEVAPVAEVKSEAQSKAEAETGARSSSPSNRGRLLRAVVFIVLLGGVGALAYERYTRPHLIWGPMVQIPEPGVVTVHWAMQAPVGGGAAQATVDGEPNTAEVASPAPDRYVARITDLRPGQKLSYAVGVSRPLLGTTLLTETIETQAPAPPAAPFRFVAFGDSGDGGNTQFELAQKIAAARPDVIIHVGDLVYPAGERIGYLRNFFEPNAAMIRRAPFMPSLGNHDVATERGAPLLEFFDCPRNGPEGIEPERNYWFDWGDARFVALDSNVVESGGAVTIDQLKNVVAPWARRVLTDGNATWKFVFYHHPFYTGSQHSPGGAAYLKEAFVDVFEECGVDIVFCGHNHLYERTAPIRDDAVVPDGQGVVYITTGAGGVSRYPELQPPPEYIRAFNDEVFNYTQVDVSSTRVHVRQIDEHGAVIDEYRLEKTPQMN